MRTLAMVTPAFPLLLVFPAMTIDWLVRGIKGRSIMARAIPVGVGTVLTFLVTHWFWADLLLNTPLRYSPISGMLGMWLGRGLSRGSAADA